MDRMSVDNRCLGCTSYFRDCEGTEVNNKWDVELRCYSEPLTCHHGTNLEFGDCISCENT